MANKLSTEKTLSSQPTTLNQLVGQSIDKHPNLPALIAKKSKEWSTITYSELGKSVRLMSFGLRSLGIQKGDRIAILSDNRPEWAIADLAALSIGAASVPMYSSLPPTQIAHILNDSGAKAIFVADSKQAKKIAEVRADLAYLENVISMDAVDGDPSVLSFNYVIGIGEGLQEKLSPSFDELRNSVISDDLASLVYTSGTTGDPKGAMLTHGNLCSAALIATQNLPFIGTDEVFLSFLPLSHIFERVTYYLALGLGATTYYSEGVFKIQDNMANLGATVMQNVPRVYEAIHSRVIDSIESSPEKKKKAALWALKVGHAHYQKVKNKQLVWPFLAIQHRIADKLVLSKIRERIGTKWRFLVSGGAAMPEPTATFFESIGIPLVEGYGLTETSAAVVLNPIPRTKLGTVGKLMPRVKIKIADDGELLFTGPNIMKGYWKRDDETGKVIDESGWFHTGDIGTMDKEGYVKITDRKKDIIVLGNGKNVAPQPIETAMKAAPLIAEIILLGDKSGTVSALVVPDFDQLKHWAKENGLAGKSVDELIELAEVRKAVKAQIDGRSSGLADFEKIRRIALLKKALSIDEGELTPTHKVRRKVVAERYGHLLD